MITLKRNLIFLLIFILGVGTAAPLSGQLPYHKVYSNGVTPSERSTAISLMEASWLQE